MHKLKNTKTFSKPQLGVFVIAFALIGGIIVWRSLAAPNPNLPGDLNNDNTVNIQDLSILLSNYGTSNSIADINSDGTVNVLDMSVLLSNYGKSVSVGQVASLEAETMSSPGTGNGGVFADAAASAGQYRAIWANGTTTGTVNLPSSATSLIVMADGTNCASAAKYPILTVSLDGISIGQATVTATTWTSYSFNTSAGAGSHTLALTFSGDYSQTSVCDVNLNLDVAKFYSGSGSGGTGSGPDLTTAFFNSGSFWRQPLPANVTLSPSSQTWVNLLVNSTDNNTMYINHDYWTAAVYHANASTPKVTFSILNSGKHITIPYQSGWNLPPAPDTDNGIAIIDDSNGCYYDFQSFDPATHTANAGRVDNVILGSGAHAADSGVSGGELPYIGGAITAQQAASGTIHHALRYATSHNSPSFVAPGTISDGKHSGGIPEGQLMRLDPNLNLSAFGLNPFQLMVAKALQIYGAYDSDSGGAFSLYVESTFDGSTYNNSSWSFPVSLTSHLQFLNFPFPTPTYDTNTSFSACSKPF